MDFNYLAALYGTALIVSASSLIKQALKLRKMHREINTFENEVSSSGF
jgi:hypothetical protein